MSAPTILCVDDECNVLFTLRTQLSRYFPNYTIEIVESAVDALELVEELMARGVKVPLVIADQIMPGMKGDAFLIELHNRYPHILKVMLTGQANTEDIARVVNQGSLYRFIAKPWDETDLTLTVTEALKHYQKDQQLVQHQSALQAANQKLAVLNADLERQVQERTRHLQHSEQQLRFFVEHVPAAVAMLDNDMRYLLVSKRWKKDYNLGDQDIIGRSHYDVFPSMTDRWRQIHQRCLAGASEHAEEDYLTQEDGSVIWLQWEIHPWYAETGEIGGIIWFSQIITERKQAELALRESEARFAATFQSSPDAMLITLLSDGLILDANAQFSQFVGYSLDETIGHTTLELQMWVKPEERAAVMARLQAESLVQNYEISYRHKSGEVSVGLFSCQLIHLSGQVCVLSVMRDISDRKRVELALKESEARFLTLSEVSPANIYILVKRVDGSFYFEHMSRAIEAIHDIPVEQILENASCLLDAIHPEDRAGYDAAAQQSLETLQLFRHEWRVITPSGEIKWLQGNSRPQARDNGEIAWYGVVLDITTRRRAELALQQLNAELERRVEQRTQDLANSEQDLRTIFNNVYDAILIHDLDGTILDANDRALELRGATREQLIGASIADLSAADVPLEAVSEMLRRVQTGETLRFEWRERRFSDHQPFDVEVSLRHITLDNRPVFIAGVRDISDRKRYEAQLQRTNEELLRATRLKDEFLATMSHELRTPLNAILGMSEALQEGIFGDMNDRQSKALQTIETSGVHLLDLINDILDVTKIEAGQMELVCTPIAIATLCQSSLAFIKQQALKKHIQLDLKIPPHLPVVFVDERRMRQVLINLLNNAVKFTPEGGQITVEVSPSSPNSEGVAGNGPLPNTLRIAIIDTGIGIAPENIHKLFQPFVQIDSALNRQYSGTGLGLALVKRIVELHGGQVGLTSQIGVGSCFTIDLPGTAIVNPPQEPTPPIQLSLNPSPVAPKTIPLILLVEDNEANIQAIAPYLAAQGYHILLAHNGLEAITLAQAEKPDLILMDIQMPGMDGLEAIQHIRHDPKLAHVPIIALTALAMTGDRERCIAAGANAYLPKPVKLKHLITTIQSFLT